ncbi:MAG: ATP-binding protein [Spirochaetales bacterium]|nr:ATP-binding protein [Spirochaetales bacterium]
MKQSIRLKLFTLSIVLILFTSLALSLSYYFLTKQEKQQASRVRLEIAHSIIRDDILTRIENRTLRIEEFFRQVSAIPWELSWYAKKQDKREFFADPTYSSYITTIGEELASFSRYISASRLLLYAADGRLLVSYNNDGQEEEIGAYIVNQDSQNSYLSTADYSRLLITRQNIPKQEMPLGMSPYLGRIIPDELLSEHFHDGYVLALRMYAPVIHKGEKVGVLVVESDYTQEMAEHYARLSKTDVDIFTGNSWSVGTLGDLHPVDREIKEQLISGPDILDETARNIHISQTSIGSQSYYRGSTVLKDSYGNAAVFISIHFSRQSEEAEIERMLAVVLGISFLTIFISFAFTVLVSRKTLRFIQTLTDSTSDIANGHLDVQIDVRGQDEHGRLASSIAKMQSSIIQQINLLKDEIKERERTAEELLKSREYISATFRSIEDGVITCDTSGTVRSLNRAAEQLTGWAAEEAVGMTITGVFRIVNSKNGNERINPIWTVLKEGSVSSLPEETILVSRQGKKYEIDDSYTPMLDGSGKIFGAVITFRDVTEEHALQKSFIQSQKMDAVGQLAGGVAHDFNNMLGGIIGAAELLKLKGADSPESSPFLKMILDSAGRAADLAANLLAFSRRQAAGSTPVDIHKIIKDTVALLGNTIDKRIEIVKNLDAHASLVIGDNAQLQSVFLNLGINASHAMPDGGTLTFSTQKITVNDEFCAGSPFDISPGEFIEIEVRDTGSGITEEHLERIFEPFFTTKGQGKGTGLGLAAAYGTVQQHKGLISVSSELEKGSCFRILLPLAIGIRSVHEKEMTPVAGAGKILLVDDEAVMRATGGGILESLGYDVILAENGHQAI